MLETPQLGENNCTLLDESYLGFRQSCLSADPTYFGKKKFLNRDFSSSVANVSLCVCTCVRMCVLGQLVASEAEAVFLNVFY